MMMRGPRAWIVALIAAAAVAAGAWMLFAHRPSDTAPSLFEWEFTDQSTADMPQTRVVLLADGVRHPVGTYEGTCAEQEGDYLPGEVSKAVCWFAGGGKEVGVFAEDGRVLVKAGDIDEGSAETEGFRGNFVTVLVLP